MVRRYGYSNFLITYPNTLIQNSLGLLDNNGQTNAEFFVPNGLPPSLELTFYHAFALLQSFDFASNPAILKLVP